MYDWLEVKEGKPGHILRLKVKLAMDTVPCKLYKTEVFVQNLTAQKDESSDMYGLTKQQNPFNLV